MDGDVEHFRPKAACCQGEGSALSRSGYYWLAYEWSNLLLSCGPCNQRNKRNLFPLADEARRANSHNDDLSREEPLFINPAEQDPALFISFNRWVAVALEDNLPGTVTINALGLNRDNLKELRREQLVKLECIQGLIRNAEAIGTQPGGEELLEKARKFLAEVEDGSAAFAGTLRAAIAPGPSDGF